MASIRATLVASAALASLVLAGCGGGTGPSDPAVQAAAPTTATAATVPATTTAPGTLRVSLANAGRPLTVWRAPGGDAMLTLPATTSYGSARTLLVDRAEGPWYRVLLPTRPNGGVGWVKAGDVTVQQVADTITVNVSRRTITVTLAGRSPVTTAAAVGTSADPTPRGRFYVTDRVQPANPGGAYGPLALGLSAHSDTLRTFGGGDGQIGIHGTDEPASIGRAASHGCIRVPAQIVALLRQVPLGTPVQIV